MLLRAFCFPQNHIVTKLRPKNTPLLIAVGAIIAASLLPIVSYYFPNNFLNSVELRTYDWRMRQAAKADAAVSTNLAACYIDLKSVDWFKETLKVRFPYPRKVHGLITRELGYEGATAVAFDVMFNEEFPMDGLVEADYGPLGAEGSDQFFARQMKEAGNVFIAEGNVDDPPDSLFANAAKDVGSILTQEEHSDCNVVRRIRPVVIGTDGRSRWNLGVLLAASELGIDLEKATITKRGITFPDAPGGQRYLPLDRDGSMLIDWNLKADDSRVLQVPYFALAFLDLMRQASGEQGHREALGELRAAGFTNLVGDRPLHGKVCIIGSTVEGNNLSDIGATPLSKNTFLVSTYLNVANTIIMNRFIRQLGPFGEAFYLIILGTLASWIAWRTKVGWGAVWMVALVTVVILVAMLAFLYQHVWLPVVDPVVGGLLLPYLSLVSYRVAFGENEQRRIKQVFKRVVSPDVVNELLAAERLSLGGARRNISVFFADVRGFTEMTDSSHARAGQYVKDHKLIGEEADAYFDRNAREVLATVNLYLGTIADIIKKHEGTLDKYIGDCVMAFWGAPLTQEQHAVACVRTAIEAQRAIYKLNVERAAENERRKAESSSPDEVELLPLLTLGTGINSGIATVGLMGSEEHTFNYTIFGREVNLASRLESFSGRGRIIIGGNTYADLQKFAPELAATCVRQEPSRFKGFREEIVTYEVPWKTAAKSGS